jgi:hypothetical protein
MAAWHRAHSNRDPVKKRCEYQGGRGREDQYRPPKPCLDEFEVGPKNGKRAKYCKVCAPFAKKALSAERANVRYKANKKEFAKIARENRWKRAKAAGRKIRRLGRIYPCEYRKDGERGEGCLGEFKATSSAQKYCGVCQKHADADRSAVWREEHPEDVKARGVARWKTITEQLDQANRRKGGRPAEDKRAARVEQLIKQGMKWLAVQKQIRNEFKENVSVRALQQQQRRYHQRTAA